MKEQKNLTITLNILLFLAIASGCSTLSDFFATYPNSKYAEKPISNPFRSSSVNKQNHSKMVLRRRSGNEAMELEMSHKDQTFSNMIIPLNDSSISQNDRGVASTQNRSHQEYDQIEPTPADKEITHQLEEHSEKRRVEQNEIEKQLGLKTSPKWEKNKKNTSYLAKMDRIKRLFKDQRYEAALIEVDKMIQFYPQDPKLFQMRGSLLERLGYHKLAIRSWKQALDLNPSDKGLKKFLENQTQRNNRRLSSQ